MSNLPTWLDANIKDRYLPKINTNDDLKNESRKNPVSN